MKKIYFIYGLWCVIVKFKIKNGHRNSLSGTIILVYNSDQRSAVVKRDNIFKIIIFDF